MATSLFRRRWFPPPRRTLAPAAPASEPGTALGFVRRPAALSSVFSRRRKWRPRRRAAPSLHAESFGYGFARHYTGVLTPLGTKRADHYARIAPPSAPSLSAVAGGSLGARTYYVATSYVSPSGETTASAEASLALAANELAQAASPAASGNATGWNLYAGTASGATTRQNAMPIALGTAWGELPSGLVAGAAQPDANTTGWDVFNVFVPDPIAAARYTTNAIDTGFDDDLRISAEIVSGLGSGESGAPSLSFSIDTWLSNEGDPQSFTPWAIGFVNMRHLRGRIDYTPVAGSVSYIADLVITIDTSPRLESGGSFDVAAGGSVLAFPVAFHFPPFMPAPNVLAPTGAGYYATATSVSATQATITIFDHSGESVAGTVSWQATGE
jgi:hypothetical protein